MRFRPCIDLHHGKVKQIVGSTLEGENGVTTNFVSPHPPSYFADLYYRDSLEGGHVIMLGPGNEEAARDALSCHPGFLQVGGGIVPDNAQQWLEVGAAKVIVTSYLFEDGEFSMERLKALARQVPRERLVLDLSCRRVGDAYHVACNRWQTICSMCLSRNTFETLSAFCSEFLVHAVDVEGKQLGIDAHLVACLAQWCDLPLTYAGGASSPADVETVLTAGQGRIDLTVGSALDIFGGQGLRYQDLVKYKS